jgi:Asparagine synthase
MLRTDLRTPVAPLAYPSPLEIASGTVTGCGPKPAEHHGPYVRPLDALEKAVLPALQRSPCLVSFSGGSDSSFVLAVAARVAEREGLPAPVPVTWRFAGAPRAQETRLQEHVIAALSIKEWLHMSAEDDLDLVGPVAQRLLRRHSVLQPTNLHFHLPIMEMAAGGSVLTGAGGSQVLTGLRRLTSETTTHAVRSRLPGRLAAIVKQRSDDPYPWLRPAMSRRVYRERRRDALAEPLDISERIAWNGRRRDLVTTCASLTAVASRLDVDLVNPFADPAFIAGLAHRVRGAGDLKRSDLLLAVSGGVFPTAATMPRPKAHCREAFFRDATRDFVSSWDGTGADPSLVDIDALRELWSGWPIPAGTAGLVQQLWLARADAEQAVTTAR